jgi:hypothetical protein
MEDVQQEAMHGVVVKHAHVSEGRTATIFRVTKLCHVHAEVIPWNKRVFYTWRFEGVRRSSG